MICKNRFCARTSLREALQVVFSYKTKTITQLVFWNICNLMLCGPKKLNAISICSKLVGEASTKRILRFWNIIELQKLQGANPAWSLHCETIELEFLPTRFKGQNTANISMYCQIYWPTWVQRRLLYVRLLRERSLRRSKHSKNVPNHFHTELLSRQNGWGQIVGVKKTSIW